MPFPQRKPDPRAKRRPGRRSRSFGGCVTCRGRHVKCDEGRPGCSMCHIAGVECGGYSKDIFFDFDDPSTTTTKFRRPLLTDHERKCMSEQIVHDIPPRLASWHLSQIDDECEKTSSDIQISRGPFGVFRITGESIQDPVCTLEVVHGDHLHDPSIHVVEDQEDIAVSDLNFDIELVSPSVDITTTSVEQVTRNPHDWLNSIDSLPLADWLNPGNIEIPDWWESMDIGLTHPWADGSAIDPKPQSLAAVCSTIQARSPILPSIYPSPSPGPLVEDDVPRDAVLLIKHYSTTVLRGLTPYRHSKTPWHMLFLPHVKNCLAALTLGDEMDHASLCAFYGTLSISAFSLGGIYNSTKWLHQGKTYYQQAHFHIRMTLKTAYDIPKRDKYKSILMALLTMVQISVLSGNKDEAEYYFLETEKFIRLRGLKRRKSRKVRLLHHCYVFERLSHESSFTDSRLNMDHRNREEGENDLHLQNPGIWSATLYPEIFGVPELHLFILSLVIRLAREKHDSQDEAITLKEFMTRAKAVERWIKQLHILRQSIWISETPVDAEQQQSVDLLNSLADTMQHALSVYFYRRIYDLDPGMLEKHVLGVRDRLLEFDDSDAGMGYGSLRLIWPAFIAACETVDGSIRDSFSRWFEHSAKKSGLKIFTETMERIQHVWNERDSANSMVAL
ncbi:unnamed protein product [Fusarium langsethiae]|nr:unnamed protein product [Fusarium langsethiae]